MINDFDTLWQMYATVSKGASVALELMTGQRYEEAELTLLRAVRTAEEMYISSEQSVDELAERREQKPF